MVYVPGVDEVKSISPVEVLIKVIPVGFAVKVPAKLFPINIGDVLISPSQKGVL